MSSTRRELRAPLFVTLRLSWLDARAEEHSEIVSTIDISAHGMRIRHSGLRCHPGDEVTLSCGSGSMRFRVVWIGTPGTPSEGEAALLASIPGEDLSQFALCLAHARAGYADQSASATPGHERRVMPRYLCEGPAQLWRSGEMSSLEGALRDLSLTGCYVRLRKPFPVGTELRLSMSLFGMTVRAEGVVRNVVENDGMGIEFSGLQPQDVLPLNTVLAELTRK